MSRGCLIMNKGRMIVIGKNSLQVKFNNEIETNSSFVCGAVWAVKSENDYLLATVAMANRHRPHDINNLHKKLGHMSKTLIKTANFYNWLLIENQFKLVRVASLPSCARKTPTKRRRHAARHQASGCLLTSATSKPKLWWLTVLVACHWQCNGL